LGLIGTLEIIPLRDELYLPADFKAGVAVIVGVISDLVIIVALLGAKVFCFGANVGLFREAKGRITGANARFVLCGE